MFVREELVLEKETNFGPFYIIASILDTTELFDVTTHNKRKMCVCVCVCNLFLMCFIAAQHYVKITWNLTAVCIQANIFFSFTLSWL